MIEFKSPVPSLYSTQEEEGKTPSRFMKIAPEAPAQESQNRINFLVSELVSEITKAVRASLFDNLSSLLIQNNTPAPIEMPSIVLPSTQTGYYSSESAKRVPEPLFQTGHFSSAPAAKVTEAYEPVVHTPIEEVKEEIPVITSPTRKRSKNPPEPGSVGFLNRQRFRSRNVYYKQMGQPILQTPMTNGQTDWNISPEKWVRVGETEPRPVVKVVKKVAKVVKAPVDPNAPREIKRRAKRVSLPHGSQEQKNHLRFQRANYNRRNKNKPLYQVPMTNGVQDWSISPDKWTTEPAGNSSSKEDG